MLTATEYFFKGTMSKRSQQVQQHALSHQQTNQLHNPYHIANSASKNKPYETTRSFDPHTSTRLYISSYTYSQNPILSYSHSLTSCYPNPNSQQPLSKRHNLSRQQTAIQSPSCPPLYFNQKRPANCKNQTKHNDKFFFIQKNKDHAASIEHSRSKWFTEEEETSLLWQNKNKSMIINKIQGWPRATQPIMTNKNDNNQEG